MKNWVKKSAVVMGIFFSQMAASQMVGGGDHGAGGSTTPPGLESNPLTSCELYPTDAMSSLASQIQQLRGAASGDPACQEMINAAAAFQSAANPMISPYAMGGAPPDIRTHVASGMAQMVNAFNTFMAASNAGNSCARSQLGSQLRDNVGSVAVSIATQLSGASPFAPVVGSLVGAITQHFFRSLQGPNLAAINDATLNTEQRAKKYGCLFHNFTSMFIGQCQQRTPSGVGAYAAPLPGTQPVCPAGVFTSGVLQVQSLAAMVLAVTAAPDSPLLPDSTRRTLQQLQRSVRENRVPSPDGNGSKSLYEWLRVASLYFAEEANGYPRNPSLAQSALAFAAELDAMDELLRNPQAQAADLHASLSRMQAALQGLETNAPTAAPELASDTGVSRSVGSSPGAMARPSVSISVGTPLMNGKGIALTLMAYFQQSMPQAYTRVRQISDMLTLSGDQLQRNLDTASSTSAGLSVSERDRHQAFNAIMAITQNPIIEHMGSLRADTVPGGGRTHRSICQAHAQLAQNCASLAGVFFYSVGNSERNEQGANMLSSRRLREYNELCGIYLEKDVIPSPLDPPPHLGTSSPLECGRLTPNRRLILSLTSENTLGCASLLQATQCHAPTRHDITARIASEFGCGGMGALP